MSAFGVHFIVARDGRVTQHHDLTEELHHDRGHDGAAIGIEVVGLLPLVRQRTLRFGSRHVPTLAQVKAVEVLVDWLVDPNAGHGLGVPVTLSGLTGADFTFNEILPPVLPRVGIWTHQHIVDRRWDGIVAAAFPVGAPPLHEPSPRSEAGLQARTAPCRVGRQALARREIVAAALPIVVRARWASETAPRRSSSWSYSAAADDAATVRSRLNSRSPSGVARTSIAMRCSIASASFGRFSESRPRTT